MAKWTSHFTIHVFIIIININFFAPKDEELSARLSALPKLGKGCRVGCFFSGLGPPAHFVRHCRMTVKDNFN